MLFQEIYRNYGLSAAGHLQIAGYEAVTANGGLFLIVPVEQASKKVIQRWKQISEHLMFKGEQNIASIYLSNRKESVTTIGGRKVMLLQCYFNPHREQGSLPEQLARFHQRGKELGEIEKQGYQPWNKRWEVRIDQLEQWMKEKVAKQERKTHFDRSCLQSFSYFQGLAENAIQYFMDTQIEQGWVQPQELTVTHHRFYEGSWLFIPQVNQHLKLPVHWLIDHPMRDLAEYVRPMLFAGGSVEKGMKTIRQYTKNKQLTSKEYRLLFSRLLFPLYYVECVEGYYSSKEEKQKQLYEKRMNELLHRAVEMEQILRSLQEHLSGLVSLPKIEWLSQKAVT